MPSLSYPQTVDEACGFPVDRCGQKFLLWIQCGQLTKIRGQISMIRGYPCVQPLRRCPHNRWRTRWITCGKLVGRGGHSVYGECPVDEGPSYPPVHPPVVHRSSTHLSCGNGSYPQFPQALLLRLRYLLREKNQIFGVVDVGGHPAGRPHRAPADERPYGGRGETDGWFTVTPRR